VARHNLPWNKTGKMEKGEKEWISINTLLRGNPDQAFTDIFQLDVALTTRWETKKSDKTQNQLQHRESRMNERSSSSKTLWLSLIPGGKRMEIGVEGNRQVPGEESFCH
jgi:hypothetical protein